MPLENIQTLQLAEDVESKLRDYVRTELGSALEAHDGREQLYAKLLKAYKAKPDVEKKMYPWPGASNVVVPLVAITVDALVARLHSAVLQSKDFAEIEIKNKTWEPLEATLREFVNWFMRTSEAKDRLRTIFHDSALYGDAYVKPMWVDEERTYHAYDASGQIVEQKVPLYSGVKWHVIDPSDAIVPPGYDELRQLPWIAQRLRYTWPELLDLEKSGVFEDVSRLKGRDKERKDPKHTAAMEAAGLAGHTSKTFEIFEIHGLFEISEGEYSEVILTYSLDADCFLRKISNPYFGRARHFVKVPLWPQPHEFYAQGAGEVVLPFQSEASTGHNQCIDAATASNAGIIIASPESNFGANEEIYPGKVVRTEKPREDFHVVHLNEPGSAAQGIEQKAAYLAEKRSGISSYNLGLESTVVGSQATATGTTATIAEGNVKHRMTIDYVRDAITEMLYLTLQIIQQLAPEGYPFSDKMLILPQGDPRQAIGLKITMSSESANRDVEIQNIQLFMGVLDNYYMKLNQGMAVIINPAFPPQLKQMAIAVLDGSTSVMRRFVERFDFEDIDKIIPDLRSVFGIPPDGQPQPTLGPGDQGLGGAPVSPQGSAAPPSGVDSINPGAVPPPGGNPATAMPAA